MSEMEPNKEEEKLPNSSLPKKEEIDNQPSKVEENPQPQQPITSPIQSTKPSIDVSFVHKIFTKTKDEQQRAGSFKVTLGVIPDYLYDGKGMRIDGTTDGRPAANAGIEAGDIVIQMGDIEVEGMMGYMKALGKFEKGQTIDVVIKRGDKVLTKKVTF